MHNGEIVLELKGITKRFPGIVANDQISLQLRKGEIHALLGENGAGKSTLMNIVFGLYQPDEGTIELGGQPIVMDGPNKAIECGIGMVHQHFKLVPPFTVTENIILGMEPKRGFGTDLKGAASRISALSTQYGLNVNPEAKIESISVGMQQRVEIMKTLYRGAEIIIFDEPTAVLTPQEITELLQIMKRLVNEGKSILLITHKLKEIMDVADRCTIIRRGKMIETVTVADSNQETLAEKMVGHRVQFKTDKGPANPQEALLDIADLVVSAENGQRAVDGISLSIRAGEIVGIAGVDGNGQAELVEAITGMRPVESGSIRLEGRDVTHGSPRAASEAGISYIPQDRHKHGLVLDFDVSENAVLKSYYEDRFNHKGLLDRQAIAAVAERYVEQFDIRTPGIHTPVRSMSGGNQQKVIIAREIAREPKLLVAAQPTRGLDVGAIEFVHKQLIAERDKGKAVLLVSFELDEIINVSDRILVMFNGRIVGETTPETTSDQELGLLMAGKHQGGERE
ncbi:ABC transporter ATP-binding protein [Paenibacillus apiarius]|uniref:ABC transporter ATP-binding protein n=1 Tax=Paenibacillus apiarius TaxID=46240 RepID=A0ABT4E141_9BACL|nr:ABC transporter ATP-binding protein [Paenibacillus apiarius]MCY9514911.1 ABC transporter ATP-binding protein [Paenibacillus apiarius]MCY9523327.1 ABC transporter ATP-binding protein [Paenibacillus apiarius]MCY9554155.1 ABC transporter ATP-binding protein [Paenibacillus apiarius]MCY9559435.1 ABC transporter ATP-binding protein [Paenibacillus apiarius]MCY9686798.1 ABC transporter ATP-binding protein [Paenibacillus apiarius]